MNIIDNVTEQLESGQLMTNIKYTAIKFLFTDTHIITAYNSKRLYNIVRAT